MDAVEEFTFGAVARLVQTCGAASSHRNKNNLL